MRSVIYSADLSSFRALSAEDLRAPFVLIVRVQYFVRGGSVGHRSRASSKHLSPHLPVDELDSSGVKRGCAAPADARVGVGSTKKAD
ncbi:hypothetical protein TNCV_281061 [Trichonephila clavipes]|nr:hypothetical protein TNCV_281061 [Trichonephila clavipes]